MDYYIIELKTENGAHHTVRKVFTSLKKAERYAEKNCNYALCNDKLERVVNKSVVRVEMI